MKPTYYELEQENTMLWVFAWTALAVTTIIFIYLVRQAIQNQNTIYKMVKANPKANKCQHANGFTETVSGAKCNTCGETTPF